MATVCSRALETLAPAESSGFGGLRERLRVIRARARDPRDRRDRAAGRLPRQRPARRHAGRRGAQLPAPLRRHRWPAAGLLREQGRSLRIGLRDGRGRDRPRGGGRRAPGFTRGGARPFARHRGLRQLCRNSVAGRAGVCALRIERHDGHRGQELAAIACWSPGASVPPPHSPPSSAPNRSGAPICRLHGAARCAPGADRGIRERLLRARGLRRGWRCSGSVCSRAAWSRDRHGDHEYGRTARSGDRAARAAVGGARPRQGLRRPAERCDRRGRAARRARGLRARRAHEALHDPRHGKRPGQDRRAGRQRRAGCGARPRRSRMSGSRGRGPSCSRCRSRRWPAARPGSTSSPSADCRCTIGTKRPAPSSSTSACGCGRWSTRGSPAGIRCWRRRGRCGTPSASRTCRRSARSTYRGRTRRASSTTSTRNTFSTLAVGRARYGIMLREDGMLLDDGTTARLGPEHFLVTTTTANAAAVLEHLEFQLQAVCPQLDVRLTDVGDQWAQFAVAGPRARAVVAGSRRQGSISPTRRSRSWPPAPARIAGSGRAALPDFLLGRTRLRARRASAATRCTFGKPLLAAGSVLRPRALRTRRPEYVAHREGPRHRRRAQWQHERRRPGHSAAC